MKGLLHGRLQVVAEEEQVSCRCSRVGVGDAPKSKPLAQPQELPQELPHFRRYRRHRL